MSTETILTMPQTTIGQSATIITGKAIMMTDPIIDFKMAMKDMRNMLKTWNIMRMKSADWS